MALNIKLTVVYVGLIASFAQVTGCQNNGSSEGKAASIAVTPPVAVQVTIPEKKTVSRFITLPAEVHAIQETTLYAKVAGTLNTIAVDKGDRVTAGQILATVSAPELQADVTTANANSGASEASVETALLAAKKSDLDTRRAQLEVDKAVADIEQANVQVQRALSQVEKSQSSVRQSEIQKLRAESLVREATSKLAESKAQLAIVSTEEKFAEITYQRYQGIYNKNNLLISRQDLDLAQVKYLASKAKGTAAQNAVSFAQNQIETAALQAASATQLISEAQSDLNTSRLQVNSLKSQVSSLSKVAESARQNVSIAKAQSVVSKSAIVESQRKAMGSQGALSRATTISELTQIRAPFTGIITKRMVDKGAFIQSAANSNSAAQIVSIADITSLRVIVNVPDNEARFVKPGTRIVLIVPGKKPTEIEAKVSRTSGSLDPRTRTLLTEIDIPSGNIVLPGAYIQAKVELESHSGVWSLPNVAIGSDKSGKFIYVEESGKASRIVVLLGFNDGKSSEITQGISGGEKVIAIGKENVVSNGKVSTSPYVPPVPK